MTDAAILLGLAAAWLVGIGWAQWSGRREADREAARSAGRKTPAPFSRLARYNLRRRLTR